PQLLLPPRDCLQPAAPQRRRYRQAGLSRRLKIRGPALRPALLVSSRFRLDQGARQSPSSAPSSTARGAVAFGTSRRTMFARQNPTRFGISTTTGSTALVFAPSLTVVPSEYEVLRQSMNK